MADQDSQRGSFWTSLPGILTGAAALITAISGLAIWHNKPSPQPGPTPVVQQTVQQQGASAGSPQPTVQPAGQQQPASAASTPSAAEGSQPWCAQKYKAWADEKAQDGIDDAVLRKEITRAHCNQYGFVLGRIKPLN